ncbi:transglutaminase domain-containing protein [Aureitalea marina]|uniref:Transglutaminase-like domain-containing protein n=1 Tax=Aureitalea marina TaxID=930804 RepID=A0A2S7KLI5_9FLAO|nr:transglutaminase domain-containing protein [Aureitalea marina]PQB03472.1 hypothetical protein BST85_00110 [Aureitalea marina]
MIRSALFLIYFFMISSACWSQDYAHVDNTLLLYPERFEKPEDLARLIERDFYLDQDKLRAVFGWIINNVQYDPTQYERYDYNFRSYKERNRKDEKKREAIILRTIQDREAVCEGYAMLFERLCELLGINSYLVRGQAKATVNDIGGDYRQNHIWNVAYIQGDPYLFDTTWGAGRFTDKFEPDPDFFYFKTPPELLLRSHYPEMYEDSLFPFPVSAERFSYFPLFLDHSLKVQDLISPEEGILSAKEMRGLVNFQLTATQVKRVGYSFGGQLAEVMYNKVGEILYFQVPLPEDTPKQLMIYFDEQPVLAYRIER